MRSRRAQVFPLTDITGLAPTKNVTVEATEFKGRKAVKVTKQPNSGDGALLVAGTDFQDGTIEADVAVRVLTPPSVRNPGSSALCFARSQRDHRELVRHVRYQSAVTGTWRDGYIELTFAGEWPKNAMGRPGNVTAVFNAWIDGTTAKGRMRVDGRADGTWSATRSSS